MINIMSYVHEYDKCLSAIKKITNPVLVIINNESKIISTDDANNIYNNYFVKDNIFTSKSKLKKEKVSVIINHCKRLGYNYKRPNSNKNIKKIDLVNNLFETFENIKTIN